MTPLEIRRLDDGETLAITWEDGTATKLAASTLRINSRAASEVRARVDGRPPSPDERIRLTSIEPVGVYAIRLSFSDGHDRGIYPWTYLFELARAPA